MRTPFLSLVSQPRRQTKLKAVDRTAVCLFFCGTQRVSRWSCHLLRPRLGLDRTPDGCLGYVPDDAKSVTTGPEPWQPRTGPRKLLAQDREYVGLPPTNRPFTPSPVNGDLVSDGPAGCGTDHASVAARRACTESLGILISNRAGTKRIRLNLGVEPTARDHPDDFTDQFACVPARAHI